MAEPELVGQEPLKLVGDETCPWCGHSIATEQELKESAEAGCEVCRDSLSALDKSREGVPRVISQDVGQGLGLFPLGSCRHSDR